MSAYSDLILSQGPSMYWRLGSSGNLDQSGNGRNGTGQGGVTFGGGAGLLPAEAGEASTDFDGSNDFVTSSYGPYTAGSSLSWSLWLNRDNNASEDAMVSGTAARSPQFKFYSGSDTVAFSTDWIGVADVTWASTGIVAGTTFHVGFTFNDTSNVAELFINGVSSGTRSQTGAYNATPGNVQLAAVANTGNVPFDGRIQEFAFFTSILTATQFLAQNNMGRFGPGAAPFTYVGGGYYPTEG